MVTPLADVTSTELLILRQLWSAKDLTTKELAVSLYGGSSHSDLATIAKLLERLLGKNMVAVLTYKRPKRFRASISADQLLSVRLKSIANELVTATLFSWLAQF